MADFGFLSDTDDSAVEELISQAKDLSVLEQVAAINCSGFTDSVLPDDLESRFHRLKSLPGSRPDPGSPSSSSTKKKKKKQFVHSKSAVNLPVKTRGTGSGSSSGDEEKIFSGTKRNIAGKFGDSVSSSLGSSDEESRIFSGKKRNPAMKKDSRSGLASDGSGDFSESGKIRSSSLNSSRESKIFSPAKQSRKLPTDKSRIGSASTSIETASASSPSSTDQYPEQRSKPKPKPKHKSSSSWLTLLLSPSKAIGCMWRSPNKSSNNKTVKSSKSFSAYSNREKAVDFDEFLSDLGTLSVEEQRKMLKKAIKEQQRMRREAAEIIKMAKQASARFDIDDKSS